MRAWAVPRESSIDSRFEALHASRSRLVGRGEEMELLLRRWEQARTGEGCVVMLSGEAGIGKSRLLAALEQELRKTPHACVHWICSPHYQDIPLYPVVRQIERSAGVPRGEPASVKLDKLRAWLGAGAQSPAELAALAGLLSISGTGEASVDAVTPQQWKEAIFAVILRQLERQARTAPVLLAIEDLHWADPTSLDLLNAIIERAEQMKLLLLVTARASIQPVWAARSQVTVLFLNALNRRDAAALVKEVAGARNLSENVIDRIIAHADGIPLFLEELTKTVLETGLPRSGNGPLSRFEPVSVDAVPTTLQASLMARLDALALGKEVAQIGSVIGRDFSFETLQAVSNLPAEHLEDTLDELLQAGLVLAQGRPPEATYTFKHALVQDAAYASLLRGRRRLIHRRVAEILEKDIAGAGASEPQLLAWHFAEAGAPEKSIDFYLAAAARTTGRFAIAEAVSQLQKGLAQLKHLPDSVETQRRELQLQVALGRALIDYRGSGSAEVGVAFERARELCLALGDTQQLLPVFDGLMLNYHFAHAEPIKMHGYADELFELGQRAGDRQLLLWARRSRSSANLLQGHFEGAKGEMLLIIGAYEDEQYGPADIRVARDPQVSTSVLLGICLTAMGYPVSGAALSLKGLKHAQSAQHAVSLILGLRRACLQRMLQRDVAGVLDLSTRLLEVNTEHETFLGALEGTIFRGWAQLQTRADGALARDIQTCLDQLEAAKHWVMLPFLMTSIAEARGGHGDVDGAIDLLDRAANLIKASGQRWSEAELLRLRGRFATRDPDKAVALLQASLAMAREQGARLWELRTATSLAEFWRDEGRGGRARDVLAPVFGWFTEGFDTPDLVAARSLLEELARRRRAGADASFGLGSGAGTGLA